MLKPLLDRINPRARIALGQVFLLIGVLMLSIAVGIVPSERQAALAGRAKFCEAVAVHCSTCVARGDLPSLRESFSPMVGRDADVLSAVIVDNDGMRVAEYGKPPAKWDARDAGEGADSRIVVPIWTNDSRWGAVQIRFRELGGGGFWSFLRNPQLRLVAFVACMCTGLFLVYLRKVLQHLDPSKVVPPRVRSALDTLAEGLLVLDSEQRIVLANQAFATLAGKSAEELMGISVSRLPWVAAPSNTAREPSPAQEPVEHPWEQVMRDGKLRRDAVMRLYDPDHVLRTFSVNCSPILGDEKEGARARGVLVSLDDVTRLEQQEQELRISRDVAERANQAKSDFLARMSHEI
ncbi:MAG TPA: PAS domain-containing protein, partial [Bradyrhizobium sp.]